MKSKPSLAAFAALFSLSGAVHAQQCATGYVPVTLTGRATTMNVSATRQTGQLCLVMRRADGREIFDDCGALVGNITSQDPQNGSSTLSHIAVFDVSQSFQTEGDMAQIAGVLDYDSDGSPCAMSVTEHIAKFKWGTGIFAGATIDAVADGAISFCPDRNLNTFELEGIACVRQPRR